ncbi:unnamed protein product [Phytophthora fragariaefolia]|uniref:Unnamed protein product n=1 Tax=Phytophthora fragariaefolia TaxID=1490495 RepID=A0A9W6XSG7_9STRA|nr:unnamed protein product [Phytophthora fragariaefolia]
MKLGASQDTYGAGADSGRGGSAMTISSVMADIKEKFKNDEEDQGAARKDRRLRTCPPLLGVALWAGRSPSFKRSMLTVCVVLPPHPSRGSVAVPGAGQGHGAAGDQDLLGRQHGDAPPQEVLPADHQAAAHPHAGRAVHQRRDHRRLLRRHQALPVQGRQPAPHDVPVHQGGGRSYCCRRGTASADAAMMASNEGRRWAHGGCCYQVIIVTQSLTKDMSSDVDLYRANAIRVLCRIIDVRIRSCAWCPRGGTGAKTDL